KVDPVTIRRDLARLETTGQLLRVHGGAILREAAPRPADDLEQRIAAAAGRLIPDNSVVFLGPGSLTVELVPCLGEHKHLTIVTNALDVAWRVAQLHRHTLHLLGGQVEGDYGVYETPFQTPPQLQADWVVLEADGLDAERGLTHNHTHYASMARALFGLSAQFMVLLRPERVGHAGAILVASAEAVDVLVTGRAAPNAPLWDLSETGMRIVLT
ncbi:MAG: DeoR/GlpR family DNA-binding transcription regulator, partial [Chloroflexota bacterium]|nr:DeoR/GlpR family DNA-binding transcription regulator [Chloroflexota bacterium]